ncbi:MAG: MerR family transcriptional regulator [Gemmatimonadetes bacterium]|nr:MerR family transcriptional regulator [Gemmatimonadota bacterium]NIQ54807.1 MerR family transcriptional regulator [Gemmatimonadota bacterium]NIU75006.1 MerR family transcriptional regulator [Gammaproteobacteria bacterium]NIX45157.1 MerR family transcriptional regulator [Gemmatimonadota bacterium]
MKSGARHPIGVVSERTGLTPDVLRVWERRYGVVEPSRSDGGQRLYTDADIERLRLLHLATLAGRSIGQVVELGRRRWRSWCGRMRRSERVRRVAQTSRIHRSTCRVL